MLIKLTNLASGYEGPILLNTEHIMSVFTTTKEVDGAFQTDTVVYSVTKEGWTVKESVEEVFKLINSLTK
jgi:hypothetical protein